MMGEQSIGEIDDGGGGSIVAHQPYLNGVGVFPRKVDEVSSLGPGEGVDGLMRVSHHAHVIPIPEPQFEKGVLDGRDVLVLVDDEVSVLVMDLVQDVWMIGKQSSCAQQDVVQVYDGSLMLDGFVPGENPSDRVRGNPGNGSLASPGQRRIVSDRDVRHLRP